MNSNAIMDCLEAPPRERRRHLTDRLLPSDQSTARSRIVPVGTGSQEAALDELGNTSCDWLVVPNPDSSRYVVLGIRRTSNVAEADPWVRVTTAEVFAFKERPTSEADTWVLRLEQDLAENVDDARDSDGIVVNERAIRTCMSLARALAPFLMSSPSSNSAAFAEDDGCVALVVQSLATGRRLTCRVSADGNTVRVIRIDERMKSEVSDFSLGDKGAPRELAGWVLATA